MVNLALAVSPQFHEKSSDFSEISMSVIYMPIFWVKGTREHGKTANINDDNVSLWNQCIWTTSSPSDSDNWQFTVSDYFASLSQ